MFVEAMLDFPEEEVDTLDTQRRNAQLTSLQARLVQTLNTAKQGCLLREGAYIVIAGQPNAGKSSLLNCLAGDEIALVSDIPGTTRDVIRQSIQIRGVPMHIVDTAGLRESQDVVEKMGIARAHQTLQRADLILLLLDASKDVESQSQALLASLPPNIPVLKVFNKVDLISNVAPNLMEDDTSIAISAKTGAGLDDLRAKLLQAVGWRDQEGGVFMARERHLNALTTAKGHLDQAQVVLASAELFAEELRLAQGALNEITGEFTADDLLGEIFSRFCIGK